MSRAKRRSTLAGVAMIAALLVAVAAASGAPRPGKGHGRDPVVGQLVQARRAVAAIPATRFAKGARTRRVLLHGVATTSRLTVRRRSCAALAAADRVLSGLGTPTTWRRRKAPTVLLRRPLRLMRGVERTLVRRAGTRCARPAGGLVLKPHRGGSGLQPLPPPPVNPQQGEGEGKPLPAGRFIPPKSIGGQTGVGGGPFASAELPGGVRQAELGGPLARATEAPPLNFFRVSDVGVPPRQASPQEVTAAAGGNVVWYTGNTSVALSTDAGRTFTRFDPSTLLPDSGLPSCCDQLVSYSPSYNLFVWVIQYWCSAGTSSPPTNDCRNGKTGPNRVRIAVASPEALRANASSPGAAWTYWDLTPQLFGQPANAWFDRSDLSVNSWYANWSVDILRGNAASLLTRISLADLAHRGTITIGYITDSPQRMGVAQGPGTTTYFTGNNSASQARIWSWAAFSGTLFRHDIDHSSVPIYDNAANGTDGGNWYDRYGIFPGAVESATVSGNTLYLAQGTGRAYCTANCSSATPTLSHVFDQPAIFVSRYDVNTWAKTGERWLWNSSYAIGWPALQTDQAGDVGIAFRAATAGANPQPVAGFLTPDEQFVLAVPAGLPQETGDYYSLRPGRTSQSFAMTAQTVQNDPGGAAMHWSYVEYGHGPAPYVAPPSVAILSPANLASFTAGQDITYVAQVSDPVDGTLPANAITWREDGAVIGHGTVVVRHGTPVGTHGISVTATNGDGKSASASIVVRVLPPPPPPGAPQVAIVSPADKSFASGVFDAQANAYCANVTIQATATGGAGPLTYSWSDVVTPTGGSPGAPTLVSTQLSPTLHLCAGSTFNSYATHDLTLSVSDGVNPPSIAVLEVTVTTPILG